MLWIITREDKDGLLKVVRSRLHIEHLQFRVLVGKYCHTSAQSEAYHPVKQSDKFLAQLSEWERLGLTQRDPLTTREKFADTDDMRWYGQIERFHSRDKICISS